MADKMETLARQEISTTTRWGIGMIVTLLVQACAIFFWAASLQAQVQSNAEDIIELKQDVNDIDSDIRAILVGIEQVKARLGIVEDAN